MKIGVYQCAAGGRSQEERLACLAEALGDDGPDIVVCPELFSSGYNIGDDLLRLAEPVEGPFFQEIAKLTAKSGSLIVYGYPEKLEGELYNAAAAVSPEGVLIANHRKQANSPNSFETAYFSTGKRPTAFTYKGVRVALVICYEVEFPETVRAAAQAGAQLVLAPTALVDRWEVVATKMIPTRAFENGIYLAYANHGGSENGFSYYGGSRIVAPDGTEPAVAGSGEDLIVAEFDAERVRAAQERLPYLKDVSGLELSASGKHEAANVRKPVF
ncbi:putative amidohydrolase [Rhodobium orientis]|uniref:CN hydrolase domain-containing protein n=1 Tax=Rhodobium orientis TaxID=34017 RepID=A0A327JHP3_9HYPH|nr:carbon-nitrogen hydrolase family protein [Rhodobium orientis]MBB4305432.1 putative amidohydrolase [Rhodobium orientis]MBK5948341.1 hypothetical protein [Rhodobium orientis]RAI25491.1 hypothetical protein CH339_17900 [Rhodobium orientis]